MTKRKGSHKPVNALAADSEVAAENFIGGKCLDDLLVNLARSTEAAMASKGELPEKIWLKKQFAIGVNEVTRNLERMLRTNRSGSSNEVAETTACLKTPPVSLQAVLVAADCNPKWLTMHIPSLASSRHVPVISLKDNKASSLKLGQLVKTRTALAIGIKARGSIINSTIDEFLRSSNAVTAPADNAAGQTAE